MTRRGRRHWQISRDTVLFVGGLLGILHETVWVSGPPRTELLVLFAAMCGLPAFLRQDADRRTKPPDREHDEP